MAHSQLQNHAKLDRLLAAIAGGDQDALAELYHLTSAPVYSYALSVLKNSHDAEDVLHDCYLKIWSGSGAYESAGKPMAWILTIAKNLCLQTLRRHSKTQTLSLEDWHGYMEDSTALTPDDKVVLRQCMETLSDDERQIVVLHAVSGFKHREIAELMDLALPTVLSKYHRAIKKLKAHL